MRVAPICTEHPSRSARMLRTALGPQIIAWLADDGVCEVMLNPDGRLWIDKLGSGLSPTPFGLAADDGERIVRLVAHHVGAEVHATSPRVSAELPEGGERFEGLLPPVVAAPSFAIRKPAISIFSLADYVAGGVMRGCDAAALAAAVQSRRNILVAGGTSTGKTTLVNALLAQLADGDDRVVLIEDTRELQCTARNLVALRTKEGVASLSDLVRSALRLRPDRIPIGEVRGAEALDLLKAWGTGHPGGIGTIHAGSALGTLRRLEQLIQECVVTVPRALIAETIDVIAVLARDANGRRLTVLETKVVRHPSESARQRCGKALKWLLILFLCFDAAIKILFLPDMPDAAASIGWDVRMAPTLGIILLISTILFAIPQTSVIGAILLTGYLGGAVATHMRVDSPIFTHTLFGAYLGGLIWLALLLCDKRIAVLFRSFAPSQKFG